jgi:pilus assembly protein CpaB
MAYRVRNIGIALALALVAGLLTIFYVTNYKRDVRSAESSVTVWVASRDIPSGTSGSAVIRDGLLGETEVAKRNVTPGAISSLDQIKGRIASTTIYAGEQVTTRRFTAESQKGIRAQLTGNLRAVQVSGTPHQLLADTLRGGDHVDVVATWKFPEGSPNHVSRVILRDLLVLEGVTQANEASKLTNPGEDQAVKLALTDAQAKKLMWATANGEWALALRPGEDDADSPEAAESSGTLLFDGLGPEEIDRFKTMALSRRAR